MVGYGRIWEDGRVEGWQDMGEYIEGLKAGRYGRMVGLKAGCIW